MTQREDPSMARDFLETATVTWGELVGNGRRLTVPPFQRNYAWQRENWEDLWSDLCELRQSSDYSHYMGSVVLQPSAERVFLLIDGQQRLATLSLLALAIIEKLRQLAEAGQDTLQNRERADLLENQFLGSKDPTSLRHDWKLRLNRQANDFYQNSLLSLELPVNRRGLGEPSLLLLEAFRYFQACLCQEPALATGEDLAHFLNNVMALRILFIQVKVENEVSAYTVFETLNARGTELTPTDLLKNYLFSRVEATDTNVDWLEGRWQRIGELVDWKMMPEFLRHYLNSVGPLVRGERLFRVVKGQVSSPEEVRQFLQTLQKEAEVYQALQDPENDLWRESDEIQESLAFLLLISVKQALPVLLAAYRRLDSKRFSGLLSRLGAFLFRFSAVGQRRNHEIEPLFSQLAQRLDSGDIKNPSAFGRALQQVYPTDEQFRTDFSQWSVSGRGVKKKLVKYVLARLDEFPLDLDSSEVTVEHVLPVSRAAEFPGMCDRLGNYVLLEKNLNRQAGHLSFPDKLPWFQQSRLLSTRQLVGTEWGPSQIEQRQRIWAEKALSLWRIVD